MLIFLVCYELLFLSPSLSPLVTRQELQGQSVHKQDFRQINVSLQQNADASTQENILESNGPRVTYRQALDIGDVKTTEYL